MTAKRKKPWWFPVRTDEDWVQAMREKKPMLTKGLSDEEVVKIFAQGKRYDYPDSGYKQYEALADAYLYILDSAQRAADLLTYRIKHPKE